MLEIKDLHVSIDGKEILKGLNLDVKPGEIHEFSSKTGAIIEELSTTSMVNDSYYKDKSIHKNTNRKSFITL